MTDVSFGERLRIERERRKITLQSIAKNTKISIALLEGLERDDVSKWPSGIFRRSFVREYAAAIGLDPEATAREFLELFPDTVELLPAIEALRSPEPHGAGRLQQWTTLGTTLARALELSDLQRLRVRIADAGAAFMRGPLLSAPSRRWAAAACDAAIVVIVGVLLFAAMRDFWMPLAVVTLGYYAASIVLLGNTPGVSLFAPRAAGGHRPSDG